MKRAIHFGAGKIGRGFIGALLSQAGYEVCFAEADPQLVDEINRRRGYTVTFPSRSTSRNRCNSS